MIFLLNFLISLMFFSRQVTFHSSILKISNVVPIHKKQSKLFYSNYRRILLLSNLEKILEKLMNIRIFKFFNDNKSIYPLQFGLRYKYSTTHALISLTKEIGKKIDEGNIGCGIFVDLQKAFDTVEYDTLLAKPEHMVSAVFQMSGLDPTYPTENNMFQLMVMNHVLLLFYMEYGSPWSTSVFNIHQ